MAKKRPGAAHHSRYSLRRVRVTPELPLATLAADTAVVVGASGLSNASYRLISTKLAWSIVGLTMPDGPITVGFAHSDYSVAEIKEALESALSISPSDKIAQERSRRLVRIVGQFTPQVQDATSGGMVLNDGEPIKTRLNWPMSIGMQVNIFAYNNDNNALQTGAIVHAMGDLWVKDNL